ncbi:hypothetical protein AOQ84DRAFT_68288, partial [Glonium stellatum]
MRCILPPSAKPIFNSLTSLFVGPLATHHPLTHRSPTPHITTPPKRKFSTPHTTAQYSSPTMEALASSHTQSVDELAATLKNFGLESVPEAPNTYPALNPVDIYRSHITELLASVSGIDPKIIYPALQWTQTLDKGDLTLPVPALRVKGKKPAELAVELGEKVHQ